MLENADRILAKPQQKTGMDYLSAGKPGPDFFFFLTDRIFFRAAAPIPIRIFLPISAADPMPILDRDKPSARTTNQTRAQHLPNRRLLISVAVD